MAKYLDYVEDADSVLDRLESWDYDDVTDILESSGETQADRLREELDRIKEQLEQRDEIHKEAVEELEWTLERYNDRLDKLYTHGRGKHDGTRDRLKDRILDLEERLRQERRDHWRDKQKLEQERRDILRALDEADDSSLSELL